MIDPQRPDYSNTPVASARAEFGYTPEDVDARPCVSIVTPFYNTGAIFHETARSVHAQSLQQWEWIIVNDGSTAPESLAILNGFRGRDARVRVIDHPENRGLSAARNTGFAAARSEYVLQLDSDDLVEPTAVEKWWWFLQSFPEYDFVKGYSIAFGGREYLWTGGFHEGPVFLDHNRADATCLIRTSVHRAVGGYDEANRGGLEDWTFWLHAASIGRWGATIPEYLNWYRRREGETQRWSNWDDSGGERDFRARLRARFPELWTGGFPRIEPRPQLPHEPVSDAVPASNRLRKTKPRLLLVVPWMLLGGAEKFNLTLIEGLIASGWEVTVVATLPSDHPWLPLFTRLTPDVFVLGRFLRLVDYPRFLRYVIDSRQCDAVLISNSEFGYQILPYLKAHAPATVFVDFCHAVEEWNNGGYPRLSLEARGLLDRHLVASRQIGDWMVAGGMPPECVQVCHVNVDTDRWRPDADVRARVRAELGVSDGGHLILIAGRVAVEKGPAVAAKVLKDLAARGHEFLAVVAGDGPELPWLRQFVVTAELDHRVRLLGNVLPERVRELMAAADIFFLPSQREGIALVCFEAMSTGLPVVAADVGGQRELVVPGTGFLVQPGDEDAQVADYVAILAGLLESAVLREQVGREARRRIVTHFRLDQMCSQVSGLLQEAIATGASRRRESVPLWLASILATRAVDHTRTLADRDDLWRRPGATAPVPEPPAVPGVVELLQAKRWLEEQHEAWRRTADARAQALEELDTAKRWLEEQYGSWKQVAEERSQAIEEMRIAKEWLETQYMNWKATAEERGRQIAELSEVISRHERDLPVSAEPSES